MARKSAPTRRRTAAKRPKPRSAAKRKAAARKQASAKAARKTKRPAKPVKRSKHSKPAKRAKRAKPTRRTAPAAGRKNTSPRKKPAVKRMARPRNHRPFPEIDERVPVGPPSTLQRQRRVLSEDERLEQGPNQPDERLISAARTGHDELRMNIGRHNESSPVLTAGDVDAKWEDAYAVGDEAPGGDNPTPDQQRVDDIGKALGINYQDDQELQGGEELVDRDRHRWEMDPASSDDWPHDK